MKKMISMIISAALLLAFAAIGVSANSAYNPSGACATTATVNRADPSDVVKDGIIGENEYTEIILNRDPDTTDCLMFWDDPGGTYEFCEEFLPNVRMFMSWDEEHGLNVAAETKLNEDTPVNPCPQPDATYKDWGFPGDEFLFQFGMAFSVLEDTGTVDRSGNTVYEEIIQRGFSRNTETGKLLIGDYGEWGYGVRHIKTNVNGYTGSIDLVPEEDYTVSINGNVITYEISFPLENIIDSGYISGNGPVDGHSIFFNLSVSGGSTGVNHAEGGADGYTKTYGVALGDFGMLQSKNACMVMTPATAVFTYENIKKDVPADVEDGNEEKNDDLSPDETQNGTGEMSESRDNDQSKSGYENKNENKSESTGEISTKTGDNVMVYVIIALVAGALVIVLCIRTKNRKN